MLKKLRNLFLLILVVFGLVSCGQTQSTNKYSFKDITNQEINDVSRVLINEGPMTSAQILFEGDYKKILDVDYILSDMPYNEIRKIYEEYRFWLHLEFDNKNEGINFYVLDYKLYYFSDEVLYESKEKVNYIDFIHKDDEIEDEIINAYVEKYELLETPIIGQLFNSFIKDGKAVVPFIMGEYGDAMVWSETVANIYFYYPDHRRIEVYYANAIYTLKEAYDQGILTQQNLIDIAKEDDYDCKMGHSWDEGDLTQVPGGGEVMLYTCLVCGERKTEDIQNDIGYACDVTIIGEIDSLIENVSGTYTAGTTLEIYSHPLMDVDLAMYVNGEFYQIQDTIKVDGEYRWRYSLVLPAEDIVIEFKTVGIEYSDVKTILNIPNLTLDDIVEVRYEHGYIGVAPGSLTDIAYSTDMEDRSSVLSLLEMTVYKENGNKWQVTGGGYTLYSIFTNDQRYDIEITNGYISNNQKHYKFVGEYVSFEYPKLETHGFVSYQETAEVWWNETFICEIPMDELEFKQVDSYVSTEGGIVGDWVLKTEFGNLYFPEPKIFENSNTYELTGLSLFKLVEKYSNWWISPNGQPVQIEE